MSAPFVIREIKILFLNLFLYSLTEKMRDTAKNMKVDNCLSPFLFFCFSFFSFIFLGHLQYNSGSVLTLFHFFLSAPT